MTSAYVEIMETVEKLRKDLEELYENVKKEQTLTPECPFCRKREAFTIQDSTDLNTPRGAPTKYRVVCDAIKDGCGGSTGWKENIEEAVEIWSRPKRFFSS